MAKKKENWLGKRDAANRYTANIEFMRELCSRPFAFRARFAWMIFKGRPPYVPSRKERIEAARRELMQ